jgi:DNA-binding XRE family transcriptional regulator
MGVALQDLVRRQWLKDMRAGKRLTVRAAAKEIGLSWTHYSDIENGRKKPSFEMAYKISQFYGFEMEKFIS